MASLKPVHTILLDAGPILKNDPNVSTLLAKSEKLYTVPAVVSEIRDPSARLRVETTLLAFLIIRNPKPNSIQFVREFARKTGDLPVLSTPDIHVLALAYELELEQNNGDWRLRNTPGQKKTNGTVLKMKVKSGEGPRAASQLKSKGEQSSDAEGLIPADEPPGNNKNGVTPQDRIGATPIEINQLSKVNEDLRIQNSNSDHGDKNAPREQKPEAEVLNISESDAETSGSEGWITPSNLKKQQVKDDNVSTEPISEDKTLKVGTLTSDFAMQNVLLQIGLNVLSPSMQRVKNIRTYVLRCHACFEKVKDMNKQFCPRCGNSTLTRVSCSTNAKGEFKLHLKKNMQWNHRGDRYSIPKPVPGAANGKVGQGRGGGKGGWGQELILTEDQKDYQRAMTGKDRRKETDLMDEDYLPGILTGERGRNGGRPKVGAGRNVNSKKRNG